MYTTNKYLKEQKLEILIIFWKHNIKFLKNISEYNIVRYGNVIFKFNVRVVSKF